MIVFTVRKSGSRYLGFSFEGHADYAKHGSDIVCAAASVLAFNTANSIEELTDDHFRQEMSEEGGYLRVDFPEKAGEKSALLIESLILGVKSIEKEYGEKYITLSVEEV